MPNDLLSKINVIIENDDAKATDPKPALIANLKTAWKNFSVGFYEADSFSIQAKTY